MSAAIPKLVISFAAANGGIAITRKGIMTRPVALPRCSTNQLFIRVVGGTITRHAAATPPSKPKIATNCHALAAMLASTNISASATNPIDMTRRIDQRVIARPTRGASSPMNVTTSASPAESRDRDAANSPEMPATKGP